MKVKNIKTIEDAQNYCEGVINDFEAGIITKSETLKYLGEYTASLMGLFWENAKKKIKENTCPECGSNSILEFKSHYQCRLCFNQMEK